MENIGKGDLKTYNKYTFPAGEIRGFGFHEAPRGTLSHWIVIDNGKIKNYQCVVPSTWNACPRNQQDAMGPMRRRSSATPWLTRNARWRQFALFTPLTPAWPAPFTWWTQRVNPSCR